MKMNKLELGTKFYIFESEDEYRILYLVKKNEHDGIFMDEETFELFLQYQLKNCERPELLGASSHTVDILRKC